MKNRRRIGSKSFAPDTLNDANRLRKKAEQVRAIADKMTDPRRKQTTLDIAVRYVVLAHSWKRFGARIEQAPWCGQSSRFG